MGYISIDLQLKWSIFHVVYLQFTDTRNDFRYVTHTLLFPKLKRALEISIIRGRNLDNRYVFQVFWSSIMFYNFTKLSFFWWQMEKRLNAARVNRITKF
jgi:hypothetical protein